MPQEPTRPSDPWARLLDLYEQTHRDEKSVVPELARFIQSRLWKHEGPAINFLHGEDPGDFLLWFFRSASPGLQEAFRAAIAQVIPLSLGEVPPQGSLYWAPLPDLANLIEACRPPHLQPNTPASPIVSSLSQPLFPAEGISANARNWYAASTPLGPSVLSYLLRALACFQREESLAPSWLDILEAEDMPRAAVPAAFGLMRSVETDARVAFPFLARARFVEDDPESLASSLNAFMTEGYLYEGEILSSKCPSRPGLDEGDIAVMFQGIPREKRANFVKQVFGFLEQWGQGPSKLPKNWERIAMASPPRYVFLDAVDSPRFKRWPAFHLLHWPTWAHPWAEGIDAIWINLNILGEARPFRPITLEPKQPVSQVDARLFRSNGRFDIERIQQCLEPILRRWKPKPKVILCAHELTEEIQREIQPDDFIPSTYGLSVDLVLASLLSATDPELGTPTPSSPPNLEMVRRQQSLIYTRYFSKTVDTTQAAFATIGAK